MCVVDDAQWLDQASALTLAFVARRLLAEPVGLVFAAREPGEELQHAPGARGARVARRRRPRAARLGRAVHAGRRGRDRIIAETPRQPARVARAAARLTATQLAGGFGMPGGRRSVGRIEESFARRLDALPDERDACCSSQRRSQPAIPLLCSARRPAGHARWPRRAPRRPACWRSAQQVRFRHPLARSAVYRCRRAGDRRAVHRALAEATDHDVDPDRRAWHLAAAAPGPTRTSPRSSSARPTGRRRAAAWRPRPHSCSVRSP